jgi:hypothetical protein
MLRLFSAISPFSFPTVAVFPYLSPSAASHASSYSLHPSVRSLSFYFLCVPPSCPCPPLASENSDCWIGCCLILAHLLSHFMLWLIAVSKFLHFLWPPFALLVYWCILCFQQPKTTSSLPIYPQGYHHWEAWNFLPDCLARQVD